MADIDNATTEQKEAITFAEFLEAIPPGTVKLVSHEIKARVEVSTVVGWHLRIPEIQHHCSHDACNGIRFFRSTDGSTVSVSVRAVTDHFLRFMCSNCRTSTKVFAIAAQAHDSATATAPAIICVKYGERPIYGPPTPSRLIRMIGEDRELFLQGRRCENQGLGIGAFSYYRRVIENQKNRILGEVIKVSERLQAPSAQIKKLHAAVTEIQFSKAMESLRDALPTSLLVDGHNPLTLLHSALSDGLHARTDEECLDFATSIRVVLAELAERIGQALKDEAELSHAVSRLLRSQNPQGAK